MCGEKVTIFPTWENGKRLEIFFELLQYIASGGVAIYDFRMLMAELAPFHHCLILSGLWLEKLLLVPVCIVCYLKPWVNADG